jgi:murein DD-endopeptidase MepM/ murein hydrolase activator NlpD
MHLTRITSAKSVGFSASTLYPKKEPSRQTLHYLKQKSSFLVASLSLVAFITGNMMGEHGWYAFWHSVFGKYDDSLITYTGTVPPIAFVPDYQKWSMYGGDGNAHTYRQVPQDILVPLPKYDSAKQRASRDFTANLVYSVGDRGSYDTGAENGGSHPGIDIRVPEGTPIRSIANGIVTMVKEDRGGYGFYVVIRHPNVPDPQNPSQATVLHSVYAHLSAQLVTEGQVVNKGQEIGLSGRTGFATGPHLHFQIDRDEAPWHPYWPFTGEEARGAGLTFTQAINAGLHQERLADYTVNPMVYVQSGYAAPTVIAGSQSSARIARAETSSSAKPTQRSLRSRADEVRAERLARRGTTPAKPTTIVSAPATQIVNQKLVSLNDVSIPSLTTQPSPVKSVRILHDGWFTGRSWETVRVRLVDENGRDADAATLTKPVYLRTAFGDAEFRPSMLKAEDFVNGSATVQMLPRGKKTVVVTAEPYGIQSGPMRYEE